MSIILDALRKSENERQTQRPADLAAIPGSSASTSVPRWIWIVVSLLAINLAVLIGLLLRPEHIPEQPVAASEIVDFAEQVAVARMNAPAQQQAPVEKEIIVESITPVKTPPAMAAGGHYPSIYEVRARGLLTIPDLHLDIHVYSTVPDDRFVFINMAKHREGSHLDEGPVVTEITPDGVVLSHQGTSFLLPRD